MQKKPQGSEHYAQEPRKSVSRFGEIPARPQPAARRKPKAGSKKPEPLLRKIFLGKNRYGQTPVWRMVLTDAVVFGLALLVFALFHHAMPRMETAVGIVSSRSAAQQVETAPVATAAPVVESTAVPTPEAMAAAALETASPVSELDVPEIMTASVLAEPVAEAETPVPTAEPTAVPTPVPTAEPDPVGYFGTKFADKFTSGEVVRSGNSYKSGNVNVTLTELREYGSDIYFVDIYVKDISCFRTEFAEGVFAKGVSEWGSETAKRIGSIVTMSGDYYGARSDGVVIRNGILYRDEEVLRDVCVLYWNGEMKCFDPFKFDAEAEMNAGAYQAWNFGPMLLDAQGNAMEHFNSDVSPKNPRAAIGCFEPGHYCMVVVDGRSDSSRGMTLVEMSEFFAKIGCTAAYNLDGGATTSLYCADERINNTDGKGRECSDFIVVIDEIIGGF